MTIELTPVGVKCNLSCTYCYEDPMRLAGHFAKKWDEKKVLKVLSEVNQPFTIFGGEPLLTPIDRLETIFKFGFERFGKNSIQSNGTILTDKHIELFKKYKVSIGISVDGPGELNDARRVASLGETRKMTETILQNIEKLCFISLYPSLIVTLHRLNAIQPYLTKLIDWLKRLDHVGVKYARLHLLEIDSKEADQTLKLTDQENINALLLLSNLKLQNLKFDWLQDIRNLLSGNDSNVSCVWTGCDPYTTPAVHGIEADGSLSNCGRMNKLGVPFEKSKTHNRERQLLLYNTPFEDGGCKDCEFFVYCKGHCPGTTEDWRNRTDHCKVIYTLFEHVKKEIPNAPTYNESRKRAARYIQSISSGAQDYSVNHTNHTDHWDGIISLGTVPVKP